MGIPFAWGQAPAPAKKLIEFGWDRPFPDFVRQNILRMETRPFSGVVLVFRGEKRVFINKAIDSSAFDADIANLSNTAFKQFTDNFVLVGTTPDSGWDWFSDAAWEVAEQNVRLFARAAKAGNLRGLMLDYEPYGTNPWDYRQAPQRVKRSFAEYQAQVRARGHRFLQTIQHEFPGIRILTPFQLSYLASVVTKADSVERTRRLAQRDYGLLAAFVNGMLEVAAPTTLIIDGNERAYYYATKDDFRSGGENVRQGALALVDASLRATYTRHVTVGHAIFLDYLLGIYERPGDTVVSRLPMEARLSWLTHNVYYALQDANEYAWLYSQKINWWSDSVPSGVDAAIREAQVKVGAGIQLGH